jgi:single-strand DNA-binding protein
MSLNLNRVCLAGNLTRDPQIRFLANEKQVGEFGLAINRKWKSQDGTPHEEATFVDIEVFGRTAELCGQYLKKGSPAYLEGRLKLDTWDDKATGQKRSKMKVVAESVQFLGQRPADGEQQERPAAQAQPVNRPQRHRAEAGGGGDEEPPF